MITTTDAEHFIFLLCGVYACMSQMRGDGDNRKERKGEAVISTFKGSGVCVFKLRKHSYSTSQLATQSSIMAKKMF